MANNLYLNQCISKKTETVITHLETQAKNKLFTAWSFANNEASASCFYADEVIPPLEGNCNWNASLHPYFDLASLTKPLFGNMLLRLLKKDDFSFFSSDISEIFATSTSEANQVIAKVLREKNAKITVLDLLNHTSTLPAWTWFGKGLWYFPNLLVEKPCSNVLLNKHIGNTQVSLIEANLSAFIAKLAGTSQQGTTYSDLNYYLIAKIIEILMPANGCANHSDLLKFFNSQMNTAYFHASESPLSTEKAIPTFPYQFVQDSHVPKNIPFYENFGHAHDTNANILAELGILSAHAGLFGTIEDIVATLPKLVNSQIELELQIPQNNNSRFMFGLDTPDGINSTSQPQVWPLLPEQKIYGHLGYTGTSFWYQTQNNQLTNYCVLLTNRTAHRTVIGSTQVPRILVVTPNQPEKTCLTFIIDKNANIIPLSNNDAEEVIIAHSKTTSKFWNKSFINKSVPITETRKFVAANTW